MGDAFLCRYGGYLVYFLPGSVSMGGDPQIYRR